MEESAILSIQTPNPETLTQLKIETIETNLDKWKKIIQWFKENTSGWVKVIVPISFVSKTSIIQGNTTLVHFKDEENESVYISIKTSENKHRQYSKEIIKGSLDFLY